MNPALLSRIFSLIPMKYLIAGLGNIGAKYELTRHNIGFLILDQLADKQEVIFENTRLAEKAHFKYRGRQIHLIKPTTFMNKSGKAVSYWLQNLEIERVNLLIVTDDTHLPFGKIRIRAKGSDAGHNGLKNIEHYLGGNDYPRLRFGIGDNFPKGQMIDYVLSNFDETEFKELPSYIDNACEAIFSFIRIGLERTMNTFN